MMKLLISVLLNVVLTVVLFYVNYQYESIKTLFDNRGKSIKALNDELLVYKKFYKYRLERYNRLSIRFEDLCDKYLTEQNVANWYKRWFQMCDKERVAYYYCLKQIYEEVLANEEGQNSD